MSGFGVTASEAYNEKQDMQQLNDKLAQYMQRFRELKKAAAVGGDIASYHEAMRQIEDEIKKLKDLYETEINKLRRKLEDAIKEKNKMGADVHRLGEVQAKLNQESNRARKLEDELRALERALAEKNKENADLASALRAAKQEANNGEKAAQENAENKKRLAEVMKHNKDLNDKINELNDKLKFENKMHDASSREMQERIKAANDIIQALENKMKQLNRVGENLPAAIQKMREGTVAEMKRFQRETEDALNKNMDTLKKQMDEDSKAKDQLARDKRYLEDSMRKMASHIADLEAKVKALEDENKALKDELATERARSRVAVKDLEKKLKELQDTLMNNSKDFVNARDAQVSLRAEIETYRQLLEGEQNKLGQNRTPSRGCTPMKPATPSYGQNQTNGLPALSRSNSPTKNGGFKPHRSSYQPAYNSFHTTYRNDYTPKLKGYY